MYMLGYIAIITIFDKGYKCWCCKFNVELIDCVFPSNSADHSYHDHNLPPDLSFESVHFPSISAVYFLLVFLWVIDES